MALDSLVEFSTLVLFAPAMVAAGLFGLPLDHHARRVFFVVASFGLLAAALGAGGGGADVWHDLSGGFAAHPVRVATRRRVVSGFRRGSLAGAGTLSSATRVSAWLQPGQTGIDDDAHQFREAPARSLDGRRPARGAVGGIAWAGIVTRRRAAEK